MVIIEQKIVVFLLFLLTSSFCLSQNKNDSLHKYNFKKLADKFYENESFSAKATLYAKAYLKKAKETNDSIKIADGFFFMSVSAPDSLSIAYNDSILRYTRDTKIENSFYPTIAYFNKGDYFYKHRNFQSALNNYLLAYKSHKITKNINLYNEIKHQIGLLKTRYGEDKEALNLFREVHQFYLDEGYRENYPSDYLRILFSLSDSYLRNGILDSTNYYNQIGIDLSLKSRDSTFYNYFQFEQGLLEYKQENYASSIQRLSNSIRSIQRNGDLPNEAFTYYYLGSAYKKTQRLEKSLVYFKKVDSIFLIINDIHPDLRKSYVHIINYYRKNENLSKELEYIQKLLRVDSILNNNYRNITNAINIEYDTPKLLNDRQIVINKLNDKVKINQILMVLAVSISILLILLSIFQYKKRKKQKLIFEELIKSSESKETKVKRVKVKKEAVELPKEFIEDLLEKLELFEKEKGYLSRNIKLNQLAQEMKTNTKYLSYVINKFKNYNYAQYINDLRINYIIEELKNNRTLRKYTVKAISETAGFNNTESFSKAFHKKTGIYPSYFIKQLNKN
jgi:AraC-like DNA-binding protein